MINVLIITKKLTGSAQKTYDALSGTKAADRFQTLAEELSNIIFNGKAYFHAIRWYRSSN